MSRRSSRRKQLVYIGGGLAVHPRWAQILNIKPKKGTS